jgi:Lon protease-like protein
VENAVSIRVNFGKEMPLFPLPAVVALPQQVVPLHIFEPRYRQLIDHALDGPGQIAMAVLDRRGSTSGPISQPRLRKAVCVCQIVQHEKLADGRYNVLLQGICRATIAKEVAPQPDVLYRSAILEPVGLDDHDSEDLATIRETVETTLRRPALTKLVGVRPVLDFFQDDRIPTTALLELVTFSMVHDAELRYQLLAEGDINQRSRILLSELGALAKLLSLADKQAKNDWPKGCSWN